MPSRTDTPSTSAPRFGLAVWWRYWIVDHAWVRLLVSNLYEVDEEIWRSNQPGLRQLRRLKRRGLKSILSLRGDSRNAASLVEKAAAQEAGLRLEFVSMRARNLPEPGVLLDALEKLRTLPKPLLVHCKSGADRTGLIVTLYLHVVKGLPLPEARKALSWRYAHAHWGQAGIVHELLDAYERDRRESGVDFEVWLATRYDPDALTRSFATRPWHRRGPREDRGTGG